MGSLFFETHCIIYITKYLQFTFSFDTRFVEKAAFEYLKSVKLSQPVQLFHWKGLINEEIGNWVKHEKEIPYYKN